MNDFIEDTTRFSKVLKVFLKSGYCKKFEKAVLQYLEIPGNNEEHACLCLIEYYISIGKYAQAEMYVERYDCIAEENAAFDEAGTWIFVWSLFCKARIAYEKGDVEKTKYYTMECLNHPEVDVDEVMLSECFDGDDTWTEYKKMVPEKARWYEQQRKMYEDEEDDEEEFLDLNNVLQISDSAEFEQEYYDYLCIKCDYDEALDLLTEKEANVYYVESLIMEVHSGGFDSYFTGGHLVPSAEQLLSAFKALKAYNFLDIVKRAIAIFPDSVIPDSAETREKYVRINRRKLSKLDEEVYDFPDTLDVLVKEYVIEQA